MTQAAYGEQETVLNGKLCFRRVTKPSFGSHASDRRADLHEHYFVLQDLQGREVLESRKFRNAAWLEIGVSFFREVRDAETVVTEDAQRCRLLVQPQEDGYVVRYLTEMGKELFHTMPTPNAEEGIRLARQIRSAAGQI